MKSGVFIDRDGVININQSDYVKMWDEFVFERGALSSLQRLAKSHFSIVIVSNQSVIGRGLVDMKTVDEIHERMLEEITRNGGRVEAVYYCPHTPSDNCNCRKPKPGLLLRAAQELQIDLSQSFLIGDAVSDIEVALAVGCIPLFVKTGLGREQESRLIESEYSQVRIFDDLRDAVDFILRLAEEVTGECAS